MSSILTNTAAMTALQTLKQTNKKMDITQNRISTGMRISEASHNAAYWSIATTMRSDNNSMSTVQDALGLGAAQVDVAYMAMDNVKDKLDAIKSRLVAASQPDVDRGKIQEEITQLQDDLRTSAAAATFSGGNWLHVNETGTQQVVASFVRNEEGIELGTIDVDTSKTALFVEDGEGLLEETIIVRPNSEAIDTSGLTTTGTIGDGVDPATAVIQGFGELGLASGDTFSLTININNDGVSTEFSITVDGSNIVNGFNIALHQIFDFSHYIEASLGGEENNDLIFTSYYLDDGYSITISDIYAYTQGGEEVSISVADFDITELNGEDLQELLNHVDETLGRVTTAASDLGAIKTRIESQTTFVSKLMDAVDRGIGQLVDADMEQESTRLQALQTQQQLGIQALSIANANSQNILALFG